MGNAFAADGSIDDNEAHYSKWCIWGYTKPNIYVTVRKNRRKVTKVTGGMNTINFTESSKEQPKSIVQLPKQQQ